MVVAVGTLSTRGWAITTGDKITELMNHYTESGFSQSVIYRGNIKSFSYRCAAFAQDPEELASKVQQDLVALYGAVFPAGTEVECTYEYLADSDVRYRLIISLRVLPVANGDWVDAMRYVNVDKGAYGG
ncbi:hypothetical protein pEaSNUABM6_00042 [Erwinia phage pEa_SNUABM_6]|nr:hypothetical protein pEaSNUABM6_00042 [Erwinia phage pEa_SNUABM_6]